MGCISSKFMLRSVSFQEELNQSLQRTANGIPGNSSDHFLSLVCTGNKTLLSESNSCSKPPLDPVKTGISDRWEPMGSSARGEKKQAVLFSKATEFTDVDLHKRSKSCHCFPEHEMPCFPSESFLRKKEDRRKWGNNKGMARARSFHTVEEYDAMVERILSSRTQQVDCEDHGSLRSRQSKSLTDLSHPAEDKIDGFQEVKHSLPVPEDKVSVEDNTAIEETKVISGSGVVTTKESDASQKVNIFEKGSKRKATAKGLESLRIPQTIEFPAEASLREWVHVGRQVHSPGGYVTPKFGSYSIPKSQTASNCDEDIIFNAELMTAFEECMQQLEAEESILRQIEENLNEESNREKQEEGSYIKHKNLDVLDPQDGVACQV